MDKYQRLQSDSEDGLYEAVKVVTAKYTGLELTGVSVKRVSW